MLKLDIIGEQTMSKRLKWKIMFKNKKAQFYLFTAVVLIAYALLTVHSTVTGDAPSQTFRNTYENYIFESSAAINNALAEGSTGTSLVVEYERYMDSFISYSKMKKLRLEIVSILETGNQVYVINKMPRDIDILNMNQTVSADSYSAFTRSNLSEMVLEVKDDVFHENIYKFTISSQGTDAKAVLKVKQGNNREIFVQE